MPDRTAPTRPRRLLLLLLAVAAAGLLADQAGKAWAFDPRRDAEPPREVLPGLSAGARGRNYGGMYSPDGRDAAPRARVGLTLLGYAGLALLLRAAASDRGRWRAVHAMGGGLVVGGALGNQADRLTLGYVRDYLVLAGHPHGIFNTGDVFMALGVLVVAGAWSLRHPVASDPAPAA